MKTEIKYALYLLALGGSLVAYAHANFATKGMVKEIKDARLRESDQLIKRLDRIEIKIDKLSQEDR